ncbi:MAG: zinc ribbon domain-containing protein [Saccharofermentans sp.]|nr:zinc ribbon domain-containing protein [Saccharofermentans sp.]
MFCTNCGSQFEDGNSFCPNCGQKIESVAQPVAAPAPVAAPVEAAPVAASPIAAAPVQATPVEAAPVQATPVYEPAPAPAPAPAPVVPVTPVQPVYAQAPVTPVGVAGVSPAGDAELAKSILIMGIVAVACAVSYIAAIGGIICGAIGLSKAKKFVEENGQVFGKAKVGKFLSLGGLIGGSIITAILALRIISAILYAIAEFSSY